jgi:hypothetical protein
MKKKPDPPRLEDVDPNELCCVGGDVDKSTVSLRILGDTLDPKELTNLLKCEPTMTCRKGDVIPDDKYHHVASTGSWILRGQSPENDKIEDKIINLLGCVTGDLNVWEKITSVFRVDIFCGVFLNDFNRGFELSPRLMKLLCDRGITIGFDIYCPGGE